MKKWMLISLLASPGLLVHAACPTWPTIERFVLSGVEVTDKRTGLVWARCSVGQSWDGITCTGTAAPMTLEAALQHAAGQSGWRLPNVKELSSLADRGCIDPTIDSAAFPATPANRYWSSSPSEFYPYAAWYVNFFHGVVFRNYTRTDAYYVRLVRASR